MVQSGSRQRTFTYNSLSQLTQAVNPESGTINYTYDDDGNVLTKTAPAPNQTGSATVTTNFIYDQLHRLKKKTYSDGTTPLVQYSYDGIAFETCASALSTANAVGYRTAMCDGAGSESWAYGLMGRVSADRRTTGTVTKDFTYLYNLDGSVDTVTYPINPNRTIKYSYNAAGRALSAVDQANSINYATSASYAPHGALASVIHGQSGTFGGITLSQTYNNRLQPLSITASSSNGTVLNLTYCFNSTVADFTQGCSVAPVLNSGNVARITNNLTTARGQRFTYDELNRVKTAQTQATTNPHCWGETFAYDIWGNLLTIGGIQPDYNGCSQENLSVGVTTKNQLAGFCYDTAGNLVLDTPCPEPPGTPFTPTYSYDAENRMTSTAGVTYSYDGDGKRVKKSSGTLYWYGTGGDPLLETDLSGNATDEYIFFNGRRVARRKSPTGEINYYFADHLGTSRVVTSATGGVLDDADYYPFGGERAVTSSSGNHYKFTGKERDTESGLDDFGARYFASTVGRFESPDPLYLEFRRLVDPQRLNLYAYARNNPLKFTDPMGLDITCTGSRCADYLSALQKNVSFKIGLKDGKIVTEGEVAKKGLSKQEKELLKAIEDKKHHVTINAIGGEKDSSVFFGRSDAPHTGAHTIAFDQAALLDNPRNIGGMSSAQLVGHETLEGYAESRGYNLNEAHDYANLFFGGLDPAPGGTYRLEGGPTGVVTEITGNFMVHGTSTVESITMHFETPVPHQDFLKKKGAPYANYPTRVANTTAEKKK